MIAKEDDVYIEKSLEALKNSVSRIWKEDLRTRIALAMNDSFKRGYVVGREEAYKEMRPPWEHNKKSEVSDYEKGLEDAMKALRLLCLEPRDGGMYMDDIHTLFGSNIKFEELMNLPAKEVVCKVLGYLEKKKSEEEKLKEEFEIGDEVRMRAKDPNTHARKGAVLSNENGYICVLWDDGCVGEDLRQCDLEKTGKRYDALRAVLVNLGEK